MMVSVDTRHRSIVGSAHSSTLIQIRRKSSVRLDNATVGEGFVSTTTISTY